jgi:membrane-associated phospholipid phosphatase
MKFPFLFLLIVLSSNLFAQNSDINALKKIHVQRNKNLDGAMNAISFSQYGVAILSPIAEVVMGFYHDDKKLIEKGMTLGVGLCVNFVTTTILKQTIKRNRPYQTYSFIEINSSDESHSFPSGHTSNAFCAAMGLSLQAKKWYVTLPAFAWASSVGYSRMHLGVHYPSDVIAGAGIGILSALASYEANRILKKHYIKKHPKGTFYWKPL